MSTIITNDMIKNAKLGLNREILEWDGFALTKTNKDLIVTFMTQAMALGEKGYSRDDIQYLLMDNASNMIDIVLEAIYE